MRGAPKGMPQALPPVLKISAHSPGRPKPLSYQTPFFGAARSLAVARLAFRNCTKYCCSHQNESRAVSRVYWRQISGALGKRALPTLLKDVIFYILISPETKFKHQSTTDKCNSHSQAPPSTVLSQNAGCAFRQARSIEQSSGVREYRIHIAGPELNEPAISLSR